jgi:hypothetical protein
MSKCLNWRWRKALDMAQHGEVWSRTEIASNAWTEMSCAAWTERVVQVVQDRHGLLAYFLDVARGASGQHPPRLCVSS